MYPGMLAPWGVSIVSGAMERPFTDDPDLKRRKQAEFLVHTFFPWHLFLAIVVMDEDIQNSVEQYLLDRTLEPV